MMLLLILSYSKLGAQDIGRYEVSYRNFNRVNSDIPSNIIYKIVTDSYGYVWMATEKGLVRYDGNSFRKYNAPGTDNEFIQVYKPNDDQLWLFGYSGNSRLFNLKTHTFSNVLEQPDAAIFKSPVILAYQKKDSLSLYRINSTFSQTALSNPGRQQIRSKTAFIKDLLAAWNITNNGNNVSADTLSVLFRNKPYAIQIAGNILILGNKIFKRNPNAAATMIYNGDRDNIKNNISSYTRIGNDIYLAFVEAQELIRIKPFFSKNQRDIPVLSKILTKIAVTSLASDYQGNLWAGTLGNGIFVFTQTDLATVHFLETPPIANEKMNYISGVSNLGSDVLALGHIRDRVSLLFGEKVVNVQMSDAQSLNEIRAVYKVKNNWFFFGNQNSYTAKGNTIPGKISSLPVSSHTPFKDGVLFNGQYYFTTKTATFFIDGNGNIITDKKYTGANILSIAPVNEHICFYGTNDGLYRNNIRQVYFSGNRINKIRLLQNKLIICTQQGAYVSLLNHNSEMGKPFRIFEQNSYDIKADEKYCYLKTDEGVMIFDLHTWKRLNVIDTKTYLFSINDFMISSDKVILATDRGIYYFPKEYIQDPRNKVIPKIYLTASLTGFNPSGGISTIDYSKKLSVTLLADVLDFANEAKNISYKINFNDDDISNWQPLNNRTITLNNLEPGKYVVTVKTKGKYSGLENSSSYTLIIRPLWYQQFWVHLLLGIVLLLLLTVILLKWYRIQLKKARKKMNDQLRVSELESKNLFAQLKPHFIFNVLTPLQSYFINGDDIGGLEYIDNYAKLMRGFLQESRESYITITKEIDFLRHYLFIQQRRFNNNFLYSFIIDPNVNASQLYIPTLILQPIVENAIEHGVNGQTDGQIIINIKIKEKSLLISVTDNGKGIMPESVFLKPDHALEIIRERLELIRIKHTIGMLEIIPNASTPGTTVVIVLPILNTQP
ncbi:MAG: histidine kinase [Candidatus Chryseobacterium colombiense]|nr:histidine kinase [Chryseobacterium sp.]WEK70424.1 MAG: histidine kinase [Chryseobacterium sp.]